MNLFMDGYARHRKQRTDQTLQQLVREVLDLAGVRPFTEITSTEDDHFYVTRHLSGKAIYVSVLREPATVLTGGGPGSAKTGKAHQPSSVKTRFAQAAHLYDVRAGKYLGKADKAEKQVSPGDCLVYSLLPYRVGAVEVAVDGKAKQAGEQVSYSVTVKSRGGKPGFHVLRVQVTAPDGVKDWYGTQISAAGGSAEARFRLALNDMPGKWRIEATDIATDVRGVVEFDVSAP